MRYNVTDASTNKTNVGLVFRNIGVVVVYWLVVAVVGDGGSVSGEHGDGKSATGRTTHSFAGVEKIIVARSCAIHEHA